MSVNEVEHKSSLLSQYLQSLVFKMKSCGAFLVLLFSLSAALGDSRDVSETESIPVEPSTPDLWNEVKKLGERLRRMEEEANGWSRSSMFLFDPLRPEHFTFEPL